MPDVQLCFPEETSAEDKLIVEQYAALIESNGCIPIYSIEHLAVLCGYEKALLYKIANRSDLFYRSFRIPKRNGSFREISEPLPTLKEIQYILLNIIFSRPSVSRAARAYKRGTSIKSNASLHLNQSILVNIDIKDFFNSISYFKVKKLILTIGYTDEIATVIANLCCLNGSLPQGAPTSPAISNLFMRDFDEEMLEICKQAKLRYSRYSDDISVSGFVDKTKIISNIHSRLSNKGLSINKKKTSISRDGSRKIVTGVIVNSKMNAPIETRKNFWRDVHYIQKYGLDSHMQRRNITEPNYINKLIGIGNFIIFCNKNDKKTKNKVEFLKIVLQGYI